MTRLLESRYLFAITAVMGAVLFVCFYGFGVINPFATDWLLVGGDLSQHYIGWEFYRQSAWSFPLGVAGDLAYPHGLAITFMDSLPLLAIPAKLIAPLIHAPFQYFGIWGLVSVMLQAGITSVIARRWTKNLVIVIAASLLVVLCPLMLERMFLHTALAGQWVILLDIWVMMAKRQSRAKAFVLWWSLVLLLSVLIHPYFAVMNGALLLIAVLLGRYDLGRSVLRLSIPLFTAAIMTWLIGGFTVATIGADNLGGYGYDLASVAQPMGWSAVFGNIFISDNRESFGYLGAGLSLLCLASLGAVIYKRKEVARRLREFSCPRQIGIGVVLLGLLIVALSPRIHAFGRVLIEYPVPAFISKVWSVVRATARMAWPLYYLGILAGIFVMAKIARGHRARYVAVFMVVVLCLQLGDIVASPMASQRHEKAVTAPSVRYVTPLTDARWQTVAIGKRHVVYLGDLYEKNFEAIAQYCISHHLTLNTGYFARMPTAAVAATTENAVKELQTGALRQDTLYVTKSGTSYAPLLNRQKEAMLINGYSVIAR